GVAGMSRRQDSGHSHPPRHALNVHPRQTTRESHHHGAGAGEHAAHDKHAGHSVEMFRSRFWLTLVLTLPTVVWSEPVQDWLGYTAPPFPGARWIPPIFGTVVFVYGGQPFLAGACRELKDRL